MSWKWQFCSVEHFEKSGSGVALVVVSYFVDFVEQEHRVIHPGPLYGVDDTAGHGSDVSASVTAYLGFVVQTAERYTLVFASQCSGHRFANRSLANTWSPDKADDRRVAFGVVEEHGQLFYYAVFYFFEAVVVGFKNLRSRLERGARSGVFVPRKSHQRVEVAVQHRIVGRGGIEATQFLHFFVEKFVYFLWHSRGCRAFKKVVGFVSVAVQSLTDSLHLLL